MNAEAQAWSEEAFESAAARSVASSATGKACQAVGDRPRPPRGLRTTNRRPPCIDPDVEPDVEADTDPDTEGPTWNVLAQELVPFPRPAKRILLEESSQARGRAATARDGRQDAERSRRYGEAWLERELIAIRYRADAGYPALDRRLLGPAQAATIVR